MSPTWTCAVFRFILYKTERSPRDFSSEGNRSCSWKPKLAAVDRRTAGGVRRLVGVVVCDGKEVDKACERRGCVGVHGGDSTRRSAQHT